MLFQGDIFRGLRSEWYIRSTSAQALHTAQARAAGPLAARVLASRGMLERADDDRFLYPRMSDLADPAQIPGCEDAAARLLHAVKHQQHIVIYSDYDVDGLTAMAILKQVLVHAGASVGYYIPDRLEEGYGLNEAAMSRLAREGINGPPAQLIVSVDCGITARAAVAAATSAGADVIVTDHHAFHADALPQNCLLVHPLLAIDPNQTTPAPADQPTLCGAGVSFKLAWAFARQWCGSARVSETMRELLRQAVCLAALGTVADVVPLLGENRVIARCGLTGLPATSHPGLRAFLQHCNMGARMKAADIGFTLAPRLNAAGRMGHGSLAARLLLADDPAEAGDIARQLEQQNRKRQTTERQVATEARQQALATGQDGPDVRCIVVADDHWHPGVIGLAASRLTDEFCRPAFVITFASADPAANGNGVGQGSGRSIEAFDLALALQTCAGHLVSGGGHARAAGLKIQRHHLPAFTDDIHAYARRMLRPSDLVRRLDIDATVDLPEVIPSAVEALARLEPYGNANPKPLLATTVVRISDRPTLIGQRQSVLRFTVQQDGTSRRCVWFNGAPHLDELAEARNVRIAFEPAVNEWMGHQAAELHVQDVCIVR